MPASQAITQKSPKSSPVRSTNLETEGATPWLKRNIGTGWQVIGPVLDIRFKDGELPQLLNAVEVESGEKKLTVEVAQYIGDDSGSLHRQRAVRMV